MATQLPQPFGKYILLNKIAMGGMAEIFRAKTIGAEGFEKEVVIKRILPHYTEDEAFVTMFIDEAKVSSGLNHPNIVQVYDFDMLDDTYYIGMEYIEGKDLKRLMDVGVKTGEPLSVPQVVHVIMETCKGLHYAHTKKRGGVPLNIVHRDVSPHNVMVSYEGEVKVMDFGIAKAAQRSTKTRAGTVKGKCAYMSPEQARGKTLDPRSDMFAVGVMMWEMLTHRRLFAGDSDFETLSNVLKAETPPPSSINPDVPPEIDDILLRCLAKDRDDRQADCRALQRELERWFFNAVENPEVAELGPLMKQMFADDLLALREMQAEDHSQSIAEASEMVRAARSGSSSHQVRRHSTSSVPAVQPDARTVALDVSAGDVPGLNAERTVAVDPSQIGYGTGTGAASEAPKKSKAPLFAFLGLVLVGACVAGWYFLMGPGASKPAPEKPKIASQNTGTDAQTDGASVDGRDGNDSQANTDGAEGNDGNSASATGNDTGTTDGSTGSDAADGKTGEDSVDTAGTDGEDSTDGTETAGTGSDGTQPVIPPGPQPATVTFNTIPPDATITVRGEKGVGKLEVEARVGDVMAVIVQHPEWEQVVKTIKVDSTSKTVDVPLTKKKVVKPVVQMAKLEFTVAPKNAVLKINGQAQPAADSGIYELTGYKVGEDVLIEVEASGYHKTQESMRLTVAELKKSYTLKKKKAEVVRGPGKARFNARPWAKVTVKGKSCDAPCTMELMSGSYTATFSQGGKSKRKGFRVKKGGTARVFVDMTK